MSDATSIDFIRAKYPFLKEQAETLASAINAAPRLCTPGPNRRHKRAVKGSRVLNSCRWLGEVLTEMRQRIGQDRREMTQHIASALFSVTIFFEQLLRRFECSDWAPSNYSGLNFPKQWQKPVDPTILERLLSAVDNLGRLIQPHSQTPQLDKLAGDQPSKGLRGKRVTAEEAEADVCAILRVAQETGERWSVRRLSAATNIPKSTICKTRAWKVYGCTKRGHIDFNTDMAGDNAVTPDNPCGRKVPKDRRVVRKPADYDG